jgi:hypothetical protein
LLHHIQEHRLVFQQHHRQHIDQPPNLLHCQLVNLLSNQPLNHLNQPVSQAVNHLAHQQVNPQRNHLNLVRNQAQDLLANRLVIQLVNHLPNQPHNLLTNPSLIQQCCPPNNLQGNLQHNQ